MQECVGCQRAIRAPPPGFKCDRPLPDRVYDTVLVPTDGSEGIDRVLDHALDLAGRYDAAIEALAVVDRRVYLAAADENRDAVQRALERDAREAVERIADAALDAGLDAGTTVTDGVPHREIVAHADDAGADLIVIGTHGRTGRDRHVSLGSVTERVVESADQPVLVVRIGS